MDNIQNTEPIISEQAGPEQVVTEQVTVTETGPVFRSEEPKKGKGMLLGLVLCLLLAVGGIGFGVWAMMDGNARTDKLNKQIAVLQGQINTSKNSNPIIELSGEDGSEGVLYSSFSIFVGDGVTKSLNITLKNGKVDACDVSYANSMEGGLDSICEITGLDNNIYKVIEFSRGLDSTATYVGFITEEGKVEYFKLDTTNISGKEFIVDKELSLDGFVIDSVESRILQDNYGSVPSTVFVFNDGSYVEFSDSMLE